MKKNIVSSFDVDHRTLDAGLYLRSVYTINEEYQVRSWDLRFRAPMAHAPLGSGEVPNFCDLLTEELQEGVVPILVEPVANFLDLQPFGPAHQCRYPASQ